VLMQNGMQADFNWDKAAQNYIKRYRAVLKKS